jgi:hypothetical protein
MATKTKKDPEPQPVPDQPQAPAYNPATDPDKTAEERLAALVEQRGEHPADFGYPIRENR